MKYSLFLLQYVETWPGIHSMPNMFMFHDWSWDVISTYDISWYERFTQGIHKFSLIAGRSTGLTAFERLATRFWMEDTKYAIENSRFSLHKWDTMQLASVCQNSADRDDLLPTGSHYNLPPAEKVPKRSQIFKKLQL